MPKTTFIAIDPAGVTHKRTSQNRTYSHTVVFLPSYDAALAKASEPYAGDGENWAFASQMVAWGGIYGGERKPWHTDEGIARDLARYQELLGEYASAKEAIAGERQKRIDRIEACRAEGFFEKWQNAGWCGRADLAYRLASSLVSVARIEILEARVA